MVATGFNLDFDSIIENKPLENEEVFGFESQEISVQPTEELNRLNINEAHIQAVPKKSNTDIPYSELFGRDIKEERIDVKNSPFAFLEPSATELDNFSEISDLPIKILPKIREENNKIERKEYFEEEKSTELQPTDDDSPINFDEAFLSRLSSLKDGVLNQNRSSLGIGMFYQSRVGNTGLDALDSFVLPSVDAHYYLGLSNHFYAHINNLNMSNGAVSGDAIKRYGAMAGGNIESVGSLVEIMVGYEFKTESAVYVAEIGTVPEPKLAGMPEAGYLWNLEYALKSGKISFDFAYTHKSVKDSILSRIGDKYSYKMSDDPETEDRNESFEYGSSVRGGITKTGVEIGIKHAGNGQIFAGSLNYYYAIEGFNVTPNEEMALTILYLRVLELENFKSFMIGPIFLYDNYTYNSGYFTVGNDGIGNGGYFSPKNFLLLGVYFDMAQIVNNKIFWKVKGNIGVMNFMSGKDIFDSTSSDESVSGYGYDAKAFAGYKVDDSIQLLAGIGYQSSGPFKSLFFGLTAIYYFGEKKSNEIGDLLYSNTLGDMAR